MNRDKHKGPAKSGRQKQRQQPQQPPYSQHQQYNQHHYTGSKKKSSWGDLTQRIRSKRTYQKNNAGERASKMLTGFNKLLSGNSSADSFKVFLLDASVYNLARSAVLVAAKREQRVLVHSMIVAGSGAPLPNRRVKTSQGETLDIPSVDSDVDISEQFWTSVSQCVEREYAGQNVTTVDDAGYSVIHEALDVNDADALDTVLDQACCAIDNIYAIMVGDDDLIITGDDLVTDETITAKLDYNPGTVYGISGNVIRTDLQITMMGQSNGQQLGYAQSAALSTVGGFINLAYTPQEQPAHNPYMPPPMANHFFTAQMIITKVAPLDSTLEAYLLALSTATLADNGQAWVHCFKPRLKVEGLDLHDIGAIGLEVNLRGLDRSTNQEYPLARVKTKGAGAEEYVHAKILTNCCRPNLVFSLDVEESGHQSWLENTFVQSARGDMGQNAAIIRAANNLTNGKFSEFFNKMLPDPQFQKVVAPEVNRVHLGHWRNEQGEVCDIRDIDYLAMLNLNGKQNMETVMKFSQCDDPAIDQDVRLDWRTTILTKAITSNIKFTGYAQRITFHPAFMDALVQGLRACNLSVLPEGVQIANAPVAHGNNWLSQYAVSGQGNLFTGYQGRGNNGNQYVPRTNAYY